MTCVGKAAKFNATDASITVSVSDLNTGFAPIAADEPAMLADVAAKVELRCAGMTRESGSMKTISVGMSLAATRFMLHP